MAHLLDALEIAPSERVLALDESARQARLTPALLHPRPDRVRLLIGPEGGWHPEDRAHWPRLGARPVSLGPLILRMETAAIAATAIVSALLDTAGCDPG